MKALSNGHGAVTVEDNRMYGWRGGQLIGDLPLPLTRADADMVMELCTHRDPGDGTYQPGVTGELFIRRELCRLEGGA